MTFVVQDKTMRKLKDPNCSSQLLIEVLRDGKNDLFSQYAVRNLNCPSEILEEILGRNKNDLVSQGAHDNPNCSQESKIKWEIQFNPKLKKEYEEQLKREKKEKEEKEYGMLVKQTKSNFKNAINILRI